MDRMPLRRLIPYLLFILVLGIGIVAAPHIGPAWDEPDNIYSGGQYATFFQEKFNPSVLTRRDMNSSIFSTIIFTQDPTLSHYPPVPNYVGTLFAVAGSKLGFGFTSQEIITSFHMAAVVFFAMLVVTVYEFGLLLGMSGWVSVVAALATLLYPTMFGHGLSDLKDVAQVSLFTLSLYYLVRFSLSSRPTSRDPSLLKTWIPGQARNDIILGAVVWGLGLATKFNAIYVPIIWIVWMVLHDALGKTFFRDAQHAHQDIRGKSPASLDETLPTKHKKNIRLFLWQSFNALQKAFPLRLIGFVLVVVIGMVTAFLVWPYLWFDPIHRAMEVVHYFTTVGEGYNVFWNGVLYQVGVGKSMWWYPAANILLATPIPLLVVGVVGIVGSFHDFRRKGLLLLLWIGIPLARAVLPSAAFYDGMRHFMEIIPPLMLLVAVGIEELMKVRNFRLVGVFIAIVVLGHLMFIDGSYFPYSAGYYNMLARDANVRYDRDIEALSVREAIDYIHSIAKPVSVWVPIGGHLSWYYFTLGDQYVYNSNDAQFIVLVNKSSHISRPDFEASVGLSDHLIHTITRDGAVFAWIYEKQ